MHSSDEEPASASSGDPRADQRLEIALKLRARGDVAAAADVIGQALELAPDWPAGLFAYAETLEMTGDAAGAVTAYLRYLARDPDDVMGAAAKLHLLRGGDAPPELAVAYVRRLFDQYAPRFDKSLREGLRYQAPEHLRAAIEATAPGRCFDRVLDLGCGTGLMAQALQGVAGIVDGVDLSAGMIAEARRKNFYAKLTVADLRAALAEARGYDLIVAADVLNYVRDLAPVIAAAAGALAPHGLFAFTVEAAEHAPVELGPGQRFRHSRAWVSEAARAAGLALSHERTVVLREEKAKPVAGLVFLLRK